MTRFTYHDRVFFPGQASQLHLMTECENDWKQLLQVVGYAIEDARTLLALTDAQLRAKRLSDELIRYANRYFLTGKDKISDPDLATISDTVTKIWAGLSGEKGDVTLKVGTEAGVHGLVKRKAKPDTWAYHNRMDFADGVQDRRVGAIHVSANRMAQGRLGVKTLIHEASHKYAGTIDYRYFNDDSKTPRGAFDDKARALVNADSYGWFILKVGRNHSGTRNSMYS
jgi:hypothetical protein